MKYPKVFCGGLAVILRKAPAITKQWPEKLAFSSLGSQNLLTAAKGITRKQKMSVY